MFPGHGGTLLHRHVWQGAIRRAYTRPQRCNGGRVKGARGPVADRGPFALKNSPGRRVTQGHDVGTPLWARGPWTGRRAIKPRSGRNGRHQTTRVPGPARRTAGTWRGPAGGGPSGSAALLPLRRTPRFRASGGGISTRGPQPGGGKPGRPGGPEFERFSLTSLSGLYVRGGLRDGGMGTHTAGHGFFTTAPKKRKTRRGLRVRPATGGGGTFWAAGAGSRLTRGHGRGTGRTADHGEPARQLWGLLRRAGTFHTKIRWARQHDHR